MIEVVWDYWCEYKPISFVINNLPISFFHNKIPKEDFKNKLDFDEAINIFKKDMKNINDWYFWSCKFRFERIHVERHIEAIKLIYEKICQNQQKSMEILQLLSDGDYGNCFFLESRCYDWSKSCRIFCLFNLSSKKIYPLFIDVNHVCCYSYESNRIRKQEKFLKEADNFHS